MRKPKSLQQFKLPHKTKEQTSKAFNMDSFLDNPEDRLADDDPIPTTMKIKKSDSMAGTSEVDEPTGRYYYWNEDEEIKMLWVSSRSKALTIFALNQPL